MKKYETAYVCLFENNAVAQVFEAENKVEAMKMAIISNNPNDEYTKDWIENLKGLTAKQFKDEVLQGEQSVDAVEIKEVSGE